MIYASRDGKVHDNKFQCQELIGRDCHFTRHSERRTIFKVKLLSNTLQKNRTSSALQDSTSFKIAISSKALPEPSTTVERGSSVSIIGNPVRSLRK